MAINLDNKIKALENELTSLYKKVIKEKGLIDSGKLYNSINWKMTKTNDGYVLKMDSMSYFTVLDAKYGITKEVQKRAEWNRLEDTITQVTIDLSYNELLGVFQKQ